LQTLRHRSIFHQVGATEVAHPELTTLVNFNGTNGANPFGSLIADANGDLFGVTEYGGTGTVYGGTVYEIAKTAHGYANTTPWSASTALMGPIRSVA
jgi:hypothetical protein